MALGIRGAPKLLASSATCDLTALGLLRGFEGFAVGVELLAEALGSS